MSAIERKKPGHTPLMIRKFYSMLLGGTLSMMVVSVLLISDSIIAGAILGENAVAGITLIIPLYSLAAFFSSIFSLGVPILYSQAMGKLDRKEADRVFGFGLLMAAVVGLSCFVLTTLLGDMYLRSSRPLASVLEQAGGYLFWMRFTMLLMPLQMLMEEMVYNDGDEFISMLSNFVQGIGNIAASILLSRHLGILGISLASFLFTALALAVLFFHLLKKTCSLHPALCFSWSMLLSVVRFSIIDASSYLFLAALSAVSNWYVSTQFGAKYLILISVSSLSRELQLVFDGVGEAITPILSVYLGEGCTPGIKRIYSLAEKVAAAEGFITTLALLLFSFLVPGILGITDPSIHAAAINGLRIIAFGSAFVSMLYLSTSYYLLIDRIRLGFLICALRDLLVSVPLFLLFGSFFGIYGLFLAQLFAPILVWAGSQVFLKLKYGSDAPLFLNHISQGRDVLLYDLVLDAQSIVETRDLIGNDLAARSYDSADVNHVMLLFEDLFLLLREKNEKKKLQGECTLQLEDDRIRMITRSTGDPVDLSDSDMKVSSLCSFIVSNMLQQVCMQRHHLVTMSFNRNVLEIRCRKNP